MAKSAGIVAVAEPRGVFRVEQLEADGTPHGPSNLRPDVLLENPRFDMHGSQSVILDITVPCPMASHYRLGSSHKDSSPGVAKTNKYGRLAALNNLVFMPMVIDCYGKWQPGFLSVINSLVYAMWKKKPEGKPTHVIMDFWRQRISIALQSYNAAMVLARYDAIVGTSVVVTHDYDSMRHDGVYDGFGD